MVLIYLNDFFCSNIPNQEHFVPTLRMNSQIYDDGILLGTGWCQIVIAQLRYAFMRSRTGLFAR